MPHLSPPTLTHGEQKAILRTTRRNLRDHLIYSLALGTGLRLAEIVGLNVGDVYTPDGKPKNRVRLGPEIAKNGRAGDVFLPDALVTKLRRFWTCKRRRREGLGPSDPLFCSQGGRRRISPRRVQFAFRTWQVRAGFDRLYPFHALRPYAELGISDIRRSRPSTDARGTSSWRRGSQDTCRRSRRRSTPTHRTRKCGRAFASCRAELGRLGRVDPLTHAYRLAYPFTPQPGRR